MRFFLFAPYFPKFQKGVGEGKILSSGYVYPIRSALGPLRGIGGPMFVTFGLGAWTVRIHFLLKSQLKKLPDGVSVQTQNTYAFCTETTIMKN